MTTTPPARRPSRLRVAAALLVAMAADMIPLVIGPVGWTFVDEIIDVIAMVLISLLIGFHPLLLPTFVVEFIPVADMLPTWTGCVSVVVLLKRKNASAEGSPAKPPAIDI